jgi:hypothetical protein
MGTLTQAEYRERTLVVTARARGVGFFSPTVLRVLRGVVLACGREAVGAATGWDSITEF